MSQHEIDVIIQAVECDQNYFWIMLIRNKSYVKNLWIQVRKLCISLVNEESEFNNPVDICVHHCNKFVTFLYTPVILTNSGHSEPEKVDILIFWWITQVEPGGPVYKISILYSGSQKF